MSLVTEPAALTWEQPRVGAQVGVRVPASSANLGPGFDTVGIALGVWDECVVTVVEEPGVAVEVHGEGEGSVPLDETHLVVQALTQVFARIGLERPAGLHLRCTNSVPHSRGMGSSATAIVTGALAGAALACPQATSFAQGVGSAGDPDPAVREGLLAVVNEVASAMEGHPDNASASVYGGATVSVMTPELATTRLPLHPDLAVLVCVPSARLSTALARSVLPASVPLAVAAQSTARGALLVHALTNDPGALLAGTVDVLHQEQRRPSYPAAMALVDSLRAEGHAATISGAGPSVLVLTAQGSLDAARAVAEKTEGWDVIAPGVPPAGCHIDTVVH